MTSMPSCSRRTIAITVAVVIVLALRHLFAGGSGALVAAGLAHGLAAFAYPSLVLVLPWVALALALAARRARAVALYATGGAIVIAAALPLFLGAGLDQVLAVARASGDMVSETGSRLSAYAVYPLRTYPHHGAALAGALLLGLGARARPRLALAGCALWPLLLWSGPPPWPGPPPEIVYSVHALMYLALPAPLLALGVDDRRWAGTLLGVAWAPSLIAGLVFAWTSGNGVLQLGVGLAPAAVVTLAMLAALARQSAGRAGWRTAGDWVALGVALPIVLGVVWLWRPAAIYRDEAPAALTVRMPDGAWRGIHTTPEHRRYLDELRADLRRFRQAGGRAVFFYDFPAGFLLTNQRPLTSSSWTFRIPERRAALDLASIERLRTGRDTAVRILWAWWPNDQGQLDGERLDRWCQEHLRLRHTGRHWRIYTD